MKDIYYIYILRCEDNSLYTGIAKDYLIRYKKHRLGVGAKYTRNKKPVKIEKVWKVDSRSNALKVEYAIKRYSKIEKEKFILNENILKELVRKKLEIDLIVER